MSFPAPQTHIIEYLSLFNTAENLRLLLFLSIAPKYLPKNTPENHSLHKAKPKGLDLYFISSDQCLEGNNLNFFIDLYTL